MSLWFDLVYGLMSWRGCKFWYIVYLCFGPDVTQILFVLLLLQLYFEKCNITAGLSKSLMIWKQPGGDDSSNTAEKRRTGGDGQDIIAESNSRATVMAPTSPPDRMPTD